ncbi:hypothetical protein NONI108955_23510 [Nocardia ninae]|uniref:HTH cro/C1-type domain-containing protein n=1 Tax=Nocardia ninae NBRC 108245 TaxID=1210091 RepID=A0A511MH69_9NOCA|nr:hypothetical protein [Nocardia ninae]GEM39929.1 hypothetical protein NN4_44480 [Nocardia ninae NBRC 108245]
MAGSRAAAWGGRLRMYRRLTLGLNQHEFAQALNDKGAELGLRLSCEQQHVSRWECGAVKQPGPEYTIALRELGAPVPDAVLVVPDAVSNSRDMPYPSRSAVITLEYADGEDRREFLAAIAAAATVGSTSELKSWFPKHAGPALGNVGMADVEYVRGVTAGLRGLDQRHGGFAIVDAASALLTSSSCMLHMCEDTATENSMAVALADLARLTGWAYHDIGAQDSARAFLAWALSYACLAGADSLSASIYYVLGRVSLVENRPREALRVFQLGQLSAQDASNSGESARLYTNEAWAHAMMGNRRRMHDALGRAEHELSGVEASAADPWTEVFFTSGEHAGLRSVIFNEFARATDDPRAAERYTIDALGQALDSLEASGANRPKRSLLFDHTTAATSQFRLGDIDSAVRSAHTALSMTREVVSARVVGRLRSMSEEAPTFPQTSEVQDICHRVEQLALPEPKALTS